MNPKNPKIQKISVRTLVYLAVLIFGFLSFPISKTFSAGPGDLTINVTPATLPVSVYIDGAVVPTVGALPGTLTINGLSEGLHYIRFESIPGYTTPEPDLNPSNDDLANAYPSPLDSPYQSGRRVYISGDTVMNVTYHGDSELRQIGRTTAETLLYTQSAAYKPREFDLLRGVASISADGGVNWQSSIAEILSVGIMAQPTIIKTGSHFVVAGGSAEYKLQFSATNTKDISGVYTATIVDTISVGNGQDSLVTVESATITPTSLTCPSVSIPSIWSADISVPGKVTFSNINAIRDCTFEAVVKLYFDETLAPNTIITDTAEITVEGSKASDTLTTLAMGTFIQEQVGGDIYSKGTLDFGQLPANQYGGKYVIGANGEVQATSEQNWVLSGYGIRSGSTADFSPDACTVSGSACKAMNDNIAKLKKGKVDLFQTNIGGTFPLNPSNIPEGGVFYENGHSLTIGSGTTTFEGKGTIVIENGDLYINGNVVNGVSKPSMLGIIVKNGNVIIDPSVTKIDAIFYIYSERGGNGGSFQVLSKTSGDDEQLVIKGAVISSGKSLLEGGNWVRKDAFVLARRYITNDTTALDAAAAQFALDGTPIPTSLLHPAELFNYDSRIITNPPPGFGGKIVGSL